MTATGVALLFLGAAIICFRRGERKAVAGDLIHLALAVLAALLPSE